MIVGVLRSTRECWGGSVGPSDPRVIEVDPIVVVSSGADKTPLKGFVENPRIVSIVESTEPGADLPSLSNLRIIEERIDEIEGPEEKDKK